MKTRNTETLYLKMSTEPVYLSNDFENAVIKSLPDEDGFYVKFKGKKEFKAKKGSGVVAEALAEGVEITAEEYEKF